MECLWKKGEEGEKSWRKEGMMTCWKPHLLCEEPGMGALLGRGGRLQSLLCGRHLHRKEGREQGGGEGEEEEKEEGKERS
jgi:hypothetical protein